MSTVLAGAAGYVLEGHRSPHARRRDPRRRRARDPRNAWITDPVVRRVLNTNAFARSSVRLALVVEGKTNKEIAAALGLSDKTVKNYLSNAFQKLGVSPRAGGRAVRHGAHSRE